MVRKELGLGDPDVFLSLESCKQMEDCTSHCLSQTSIGTEIYHSHAPMQGLGLCRMATLSSHHTAIAGLLMDQAESRQQNTKTTFPENTTLVELQNRILLSLLLGLQ